MKTALRIIVLVVIALCLSVMASAEDLTKYTHATVEKKAKPVTYEVTINITYNAVSPEKAVELVKEMTDRHSPACKVDVRVKKGGNDEILVINSDTVYGNITYLPNK